MNVKSEIRQASIGFLIFQYYHSISPRRDGRKAVIQKLDVWEYINRKLAGISIGEVERALDELEEVGIMRIGMLLASGSIDPDSKSKLSR